MPSLGKGLEGEMARNRQSWLRSLILALPGYLFTVIAAIPASILGWLLLANGYSRQNALFVSIMAAVSVGFMLEGLVKIGSRSVRKKKVTDWAYFEVSIQYISSPPTRQPVFQTATEDDEQYAHTLIFFGRPPVPAFSQFHRIA